MSQLFTGCRVFTGRGPDAFASAVRVDDGRVTWVGAAARAPHADASVDLGGAVVLPGLLDVHTHPLLMAALAADADLLPPACRSRADVLAALRARAASGVEWVTGYGYSEDTYADGPPTLADLDAVAPDRPVFIQRADGHNAMANSVALRRAGLHNDSPDPPGAALGRDAAGHLDGRLIEPPALALVDRLRPAPTAADLADRLVGLNDHFLGHGLVTLDDKWANAGPDPWGTYVLAKRRGFVPDVAVFFGWADSVPDVTALEPAPGLRVGGVKVFLDGAFSSRTAWVDAPYPGSCDHGMATLADADLRDACAWAREHGVQLAAHAMGDAAIGHLLDVLAGVEPWLGERPSIVVEHASVLTPRLLERVRARPGVGVVTHTNFFFAEWASYAANLTDAAWPHTYPLRALYDSPGPLALASDAPATAWSDCDNPWLSIAAAVTRRTVDGTVFNPAQALTVGEALHLYTGRAAQSTTNRGVGVLAPGADASFVVLDADPFALDPADLGSVRAREVWLRGQSVDPARPRRSSSGCTSGSRPRNDR